MARWLGSRRSFLATAAAGATAITWPVREGWARQSAAPLEAGEAVVDTTPPLGLELAGFHRPVGQERRITGIRQPTAARALVLRQGEVTTAIVSLDAICVSADMTARVQQQIAQQVGIPAHHVRLCATHTHSMPTFCYLRQWGAIPQEYMAAVEKNIVQAVEMAKSDLAPATARLGKARAPGASNNRTVKTWKSDEEFTAQSDDSERWLDTMVHVLHFERGAGKPNLLWYHFTAHPVCYSDEQAGPDWPGMVADLVREKHQVRPSFLQGHCGDVNASDGEKWIGTAENTATRVAAAITQALASARDVRNDRLQLHSQSVGLPLDMQLFGEWLEAYRRDPSQCASGPWVDAGFAQAWFEASAQREQQQQLLSPLTVLQLGDVAMVFHPAELYTCYGLTIRRDSPLPDTLVVGYTDDCVGYLPDPNSYVRGEYEALVVPKILDLPPFVTTAGRTLASTAVAMLKQLVV